MVQSPLRDTFFQASGEPVPKAAMPPPLPGNTTDALRELRDAVDRGDNGPALAKLYASTVESTAGAVQEHGTNTLESLQALGAAIQGMALLDGNAQALNDVNAVTRKLLGARAIGSETSQELSL